MKKDKLNFLIIEDEADLRMIYDENIKDWCTEQGIVPSIIEANDGVIASQKFSKMDFDVMVVDINMPKRNGIEFLKTVQSKVVEEDIKVILVSGALTKTHLLEALDIGVKNIMVKPFKASEFSGMLDKVLK